MLTYSPVAVRQALRAADRQDALVVVDVERGQVDAQAVVGEIALEADFVRGRLFAIHAHELRDLERPRVERLRAIAGRRRRIRHEGFGELVVDARLPVEVALVGGPAASRRWSCRSPRLSRRSNSAHRRSARTCRSRARRHARSPRGSRKLVVFWPLTSSAVGTKAGMDTCCELVNSPSYQNAPTVQSNLSPAVPDRRASKVFASTSWMPSTSCTLNGDWSESVAKAPSNLLYDPMISSSVLSPKWMLALALKACCSNEVCGLVVKPVTGSWYVA